MNKLKLEEALKYYKLGFSIFPTGPDKKPLIPWKKYQKEKADEEQIRKWFEQFPEMNIGIVTGQISGLAVVDVEEGGDISRLPITARAITGGKGWHYYYKYPNREIKNSARKIGPLTDIRGEGGYVVAPPSVSTKGPYSWDISLEDMEPIDFPEELINKIDFVNSNSELPTLEDVLQGERNDAATKYAGKLMHHLPQELWDTAGWAALKEWNLIKVKPPLSEIELKSVFKSIKQIESLKKGSNGKEIEYKPFTLQELYSEQFTAPRWVIQDLIPMGALIAITGDSNSYKTFLTQAIAGSIGNGKKFLDHFDTEKGKILIIDEENHRRQIQERFNQLGIEPTSDIVFLSMPGLKVDNEQHLDKLLELIEKEKPSVVVLDSLVRMHSGEENSATDMSKAFTAIRRLVSDDRSVVFIHHHRKPQGFGKKSNSQSVRGSSDILAAVDVHLAVDRKDTSVTVTQTKMRLQPELKPFKVNLAPDGIGHLVFVYNGDDTTEEDEMRDAYQKVSDNLKSGSMTIDDLLSATSLPNARLRKAVKDLIKSKEIVLKNRGAHGVCHYALPEPSESDDFDSKPF